MYKRQVAGSPAAQQGGNKALAVGDVVVGASSTNSETGRTVIFPGATDSSQSLYTLLRVFGAAEECVKLLVMTNDNKLYGSATPSRKGAPKGA